ncbi:MAG: carbohydrate kinase family protein [Gemmataceae bacterium]|nr:carbohydrate kinase family protein [Gemmataceae bacterium]
MSDDPFTRSDPPPRVLGTGLVALDAVIPYGTGTLSQLRAGGTCGNVLAILSYLGWQSYPVARLKDDAASRHLRDDLDRWSVCLDFVSVNPEGSTPVFVHRIGRTEAGEAIHSFTRRCPGCGSLLPGYKAPTASAIEQMLPMIPQPEVFFFDRASRGSLMLAKHCAAQGALVMFEPSGAGEPHLFREAVQASHALKYSHERLGEAEELLSDCAVLLQIETLGKDGLRYRSRLRSAHSNGWRVLRALPAEWVQDTSGAGDWCTAGILHRLGQRGFAGFLTVGRDELAEAFRFGQALSAWNCGFEGARGGMYRLTRQEFSEEVRAIYASGRVGDIGQNRSVRAENLPRYDFCSLCNSD